MVAPINPSGLKSSGLGGGSHDQQGGQRRLSLLCLPSSPQPGFQTGSENSQQQGGCGFGMEAKSKISHPPPHPTPRNLPPIRPLEQARGVRGRVVDGSLGVAEVVVGAAESVGRLAQEIGAHRPGRSRNGPGWEDVGGTPLRLSHLRFKMKTLGGAGAPVTVSRLLRFVLCWRNKEPIQLCWRSWMQDHAQTGTGLARLHGDSRSRVTMEMMAP